MTPANTRLLFQSNAPYWFKTPIPGPAPGPHMRRPGCNGAVCYCNDQVRENKMNTTFDNVNVNTKWRTLISFFQDFCNLASTHIPHSFKMLIAIVAFSILYQQACLKELGNVQKQYYKNNRKKRAENRCSFVQFIILPLDVSDKCSRSLEYLISIEVGM